MANGNWNGGEFRNALARTVSSERAVACYNRGMSELLRALSIISAMYGIGFGLQMVPAGLFVGPHILFAAVSHIAVGILFLLAALALGRRQRRGIRLALGGSLLVTGIGALGLLETAQREEAAGFVFFTVFTAYFLLMAGIAAFLTARPKSLLDPMYSIC